MGQHTVRNFQRIIKHVLLQLWMEEEETYHDSDLPHTQYQQQSPYMLRFGNPGPKPLLATSQHLVGVDPNGEVQSYIWICRFARHFEKAAKTVYSRMVSNLMVGRLSHFEGQKLFISYMVLICTNGKQCCWWFSNPNCFNPSRSPTFRGKRLVWRSSVFVHLNFRESMT